MSESERDRDAGNPFSTRYVRPGAVAYLFEPGEDAAGVVGRLAGAGWRGEIVGPHGSGKSTLLAEVIPAIEALGREVVLVELHDGQRRLPSEALVRASTHATGSADVVLVVDGYEQLPWWRRWLLQRRCRRRGVGLLVTTHRSVGLPSIHIAKIDVERAEAVIARLLDGWPDVISKERVRDCVQRHGQDLREALFELYDLFERRR